MCGTTRLYILGGLFFLLYINDLPQRLNKTKPRLFADDTNLTASANSITNVKAAVDSDLGNPRKSLPVNKLSLNEAKTQFISNGTETVIKIIFNSHVYVCIENRHIERVDKCETLGIKIDWQLSWK